MMQEPLISFENIEKHYGSARVLGPLSLDVRPGEIVGMVGDNGAGKSTLLRIAAGVESPDRGEVRCFRAAPGEIGYVPQEPALYQSLTGMQNVRYWASAIGLHGRRLRLRSKYLLEKVRLTEKANKAVSGYSGGMKRRLNLACALVGDVRLLLLDEPTVGADRPSVELMLAAIKEHAQRGCAVIFVSHHRDEILSIADRIITLDKGVIAGERQVEKPSAAPKTDEQP